MITSLLTCWQRNNFLPYVVLFSQLILQGPLFVKIPWPYIYLQIDHHEPDIKTVYSFSTGASIEWRLFQSISLNRMLAPIQPYERMTISSEHVPSPTNRIITSGLLTSSNLTCQAGLREAKKMSTTSEYTNSPCRCNCCCCWVFSVFFFHLK